jgi:hypothetical protein
MDSYYYGRFEVLYSFLVLYVLAKVVADAFCLFQICLLSVNALQGHLNCSV